MGLGRARLQNLRLLFSRATGFVQRVQVSARVSQGSSGIGRGQFVCPPAECVTGRIAILDALKFPMTPLTIFGLFAVTAMLVCYALEARHHPSACEIRSRPDGQPRDRIAGTGPVEFSVVSKSVTVRNRQRMNFSLPLAIRPKEAAALRRL